MQRENTGLRGCCYFKLGLILAAMLLGTGCGTSPLRVGDTLIPPVPASAQQAYSALSNLNNAGVNSLARPSSDMILTLPDTIGVPASICADTRYLYVLDAKDASIEVYDADNASLTGRLEENSLKDCSCLTVKDYNLYVFNAKSGGIMLFSSSGSLLSTYDTGLEGVVMEKLLVAKDRRIILKYHKGLEGCSRLAVLDTGTGSVNEADTGSLISPGPGLTADIWDMCLFGDNTVLMAASGRLYLFNAVSESIEKSCTFPYTAGNMAYDGNVLYYAADGAISLSPKNTADYSGAETERHVARLLVNGEFPWPGSEDILKKWVLDDLRIPYSGERHICMAQNTRYLYFLDMTDALQSDAGTGKEGFMIYRLAK